MAAKENQAPPKFLKLLLDSFQISVIFVNIIANFSN